MKKILFIFAALIAFTIFGVIVISTPSDILYLLNWGEYIDIDDDVDYKSVVTKFEEKYNCQVVMETVTSSEAMYQKITAGTTAYDVAIPGDYVVKQMYDEGYLREMDVKNSEYEYLSNYQNIFVSSLNDLIKNQFEGNRSDMDRYFMPYFWGAYSIIYNKTFSDVEDVVKSNGFNALFDKSLYEETVKVGMYDTSRWAIASYLMGQGLDPNITSLNGNCDGDIDSELKNKLISSIYTAKFDQWDNDNLKRNTSTHELDMCFTQLGDFFDALYLLYNEEGLTKDDININVFVPSTTAAFFDAMVIPTTCEHYDLANKFINFMLDPENAYQNAQAIGYCPTLKEVVNLYEEAKETEYYFGDEDTEGSLSYKEFHELYPNYLNPLYGVDKVYMLEPKNSNYLTTCETIVNSAKTK